MGLHAPNVPNAPPKVISLERFAGRQIVGALAEIPATPTKSISLCEYPLPTNRPVAVGGKT
jgi:hypothetical protein